MRVRHSSQWRKRSRSATQGVPAAAASAFWLQAGSAPQAGSTSASTSSARPSGVQRWPAGAPGRAGTSTAGPPSSRTTSRRAAWPSRGATTASRVPSGEKRAPLDRSWPVASGVGWPPPAGTSQTAEASPEPSAVGRETVKATCLPSGESAGSLTRSKESRSSTVMGWMGAAASASRSSVAWIIVVSVVWRGRVRPPGENGEGRSALDRPPCVTPGAAEG